MKTLSISGGKYKNDIQNVDIDIFICIFSNKKKP